MGALLVLLAQVPKTVVANKGGTVKITATALGLMLLVLVLSGLNTARFLKASSARRAREPSVLIDNIVIGGGLAVLLSVV